MNKFGFDHCFLADEYGYRLTVLVCRERTSGMTMATVIPSKGCSGKFMTDRVMKFFEECGDQAGHITTKTDQAALIAYFMRRLVTERGKEIGCRTNVLAGVRASASWRKPSKPWRVKSGS